MIAFYNFQVYMGCIFLYRVVWYVINQYTGHMFCNVGVYIGVILLNRATTPIKKKLPQILQDNVGCIMEGVY